MGDTVCLDESMLKPRPIGNEFKTMCDGRSKIVMHIELEKVGRNNCHLSSSNGFFLKGSGCIVIADSWFGSVKSAVQLMDHRAYSIMVVKTAAHKLYPRHPLGTTFQVEIDISHYRDRKCPKQLNFWTFSSLQHAQLTFQGHLPSINILEKFQGQ